MSFYAPGKTNTAKNKAHIDYIATRPGVVKEMEPAYEEMLDPGTAAGHVKYAHERPGSHGLFGPEPKMDLSSVKKELGSHDGIVWRMIVSLREEDACRLDLTSRRQWEQKMRASIPDVAAKMGIPISNLRWCAAFHNEPGHPHVHVMIWEQEARRSRGKLSQAERKEVRREFAKEIYAEERMQLNREKTAERDLIRDMIRHDIEGVINLKEELAIHRDDVKLDLKMVGQSAKGIAPVIPIDLGRELLSRIKELADIMPNKGRVALKYMPESVKDKVKSLSDWCLSQPGVKIHVQKFLKAHEGLTKMHVLSPDKIDQAKDRAYEDLQNRVSQIFLHAAKGVQDSSYGEADFTPTKGNSFAQSIFSQVFFAIQSEKDKAEAKSAIRQRKEGERKKKKQRSLERG